LWQEQERNQVRHVLAVMVASNRYHAEAEQEETEKTEIIKDRTCAYLDSHCSVTAHAVGANWFWSIVHGSVLSVISCSELESGAMLRRSGRGA